MPYGKLDFIVKEMLRKYPECSYNISKSTKSESIYLFITDGHLKRSLRISDHRNGYNHFFNTEMVSDKINENCLRGAIRNLCNSMRRSRKNYCFRLIATQIA